MENYILLVGCGNSLGTHVKTRRQRAITITIECRGLFYPGERELACNTYARVDISPPTKKGHRCICRTHEFSSDKDGLDA